MSRFDRDFWCEGQHLYSRITERLLHPYRYGIRQLQPPVLNKFRNLPTGNGAYAETSVFVILKNLFVIRGELRIIVDPPDPNMCIQNNHDSASQSSSANAEKGLS